MLVGLVNSHFLVLNTVIPSFLSSYSFLLTLLLLSFCHKHHPHFPLSLFYSTSLNIGVSIYTSEAWLIHVAKLINTYSSTVEKREQKKGWKKRIAPKLWSHDSNSQRDLDSNPCPTFLLAEWFWETCWTSLSLGYLDCQMGIRTLTFQSCWD